METIWEEFADGIDILKLRLRGFYGISLACLRFHYVGDGELVDLTSSDPGHIQVFSFLRLEMRLQKAADLRKYTETQIFGITL